MPIKETLKGPLVRSNYSNGYGLPGSNYGRERIISASNPGSSRVSSRTKNTTTTSSITPNKIVISYDNMFVRDVQIKRSSHLPNISQNSANGYPKYLSADMHENENSFFEGEVSFGTPRRNRLSGGATKHKHQEIDKQMIHSPGRCKIKPTGLPSHYDYAKTSRVSVISLGLMPTQEGTKTKSTNFQCFQMPQPLKLPKTRTRGTQSLYRETSAQTLPYLPGVSNDPDELESMELFKLPTILPGDGPPGLYEVEVLERARKRWAFAKALKENFRKQLCEARLEAKLPQHDNILEAFEWEHWIEREEYIQECQMLRLEILIRMFDRREQQMHHASQLRIQQSCAQIEAKRQAALRKNKIEFSRGMRRLEMQHSKQSRIWRKENISQSLGDPSSEFYAPQMRYGVDPSRRHYTTSRKGFDMRMDDLERRTVRMDPGDLKCPFAKLRAWSKPKELMQEVEQNFCSDGNLKKLYESLRGLRETTEITNTTPLCLKPREVLTTILEERSSAHSTKDFRVEEVEPFDYYTEDYLNEDADIQLQKDEHQNYLQELHSEKQAEREQREYLQNEMRNEELEALIQAYEGNTIGWLMRFLSEEMSRLREQRKLHFFTMLAKRERWQRDAAEAGLRQKENIMRETCEQFYKECEVINREMAEQYMQTIMDNDIEAYADKVAEDHVVAVAKDLDKEIAGWLDSFKDKQNPLNYHKLRHALKDIIMPDMEKIVYRQERDNCIDYIINGVLMPNVYQLLEPYDISFAVANDFVDRLIDNDIYFNSADCSSDCEATEDCSCSQSQHEAKAILRKLIRHSVPGKRWRSSSERVADENVKDILDDVFEKVIPKKGFIEMDKPMNNFENKFSYIDLNLPQQELYYSDASQDGSIKSNDYYKVHQMGKACSLASANITKGLENTEKLFLADTDNISADRFIMHKENFQDAKPQRMPKVVQKIPSTHDIASVWNFNRTPSYCRTSSDEIPFEEDFVDKSEMAMKPQYSSAEEEELKESWSIEISSSHDGFENEEIMEEDIFENEKFRMQDRQKKLEVHFDDAPRMAGLEPEQSTDEDSDVDGVIPVAFSYDPTVKFTVPVPSTIQMSIDVENLEVETELELETMEQMAEEDKE